MTADKEFHKLVAAQRGRQTPAPGDQDLDEAPEDAYSSRSANKQRLMVTFVLRSGEAVAFGYSFLANISYKPAGEILLNFSGQLVLLEGHNLLPLFDALANHRVVKITESDPLLANLTATEGTVVTKIEVMEPA